MQPKMILAITATVAAVAVGVAALANVESDGSAEVLPVAQAGTGPEIVVYKTRTCGCCSAWIDHMKASGFRVTAVDVDAAGDLMQLKAREGISANLASCHTALVDGYVIEGHVPADLVQRLLAERPQVRGLAVPGMPMGSPGMEGPRKEAYDVLTFDGEGNTAVYARR